MNDAQHYLMSMLLGDDAPDIDSAPELDDPAALRAKLAEAERQRDAQVVTIAALNAQIEDEKLRYQSLSEITNQTYDAVWALMYPDEPGGWEYPGQLINHVGLGIKDLKQRAVDAETQRDELAMRLKPLVFTPDELSETSGFDDADEIAMRPLDDNDSVTNGWRHMVRFSDARAAAELLVRLAPLPEGSAS